MDFDCRAVIALESSRSNAAREQLHRLRRPAMLRSCSSRAQAGSVLLADGSSQPLRLREVAGSADAASRTWRARYAVIVPPAQADALALGSVARVRLDSASSTAGTAVVMAVPVGAIDERGSGPRIWRVVDGKAVPTPVKLLSIDLEIARIAADLPAGARVVAVGTHLLEPGMAVREQAR